MTLKETLLSYDIVIENEYLETYLHLIESNKTTQRIKSKTQLHHAIPVSYYGKLYNQKDKNKQRGLADSDPKNVCVNLCHKDHVLAHWYLYKCSKTPEMKYCNSYAVLYMLRIHEMPECDQDIIDAAINYGEVYTEFCIQQSLRYKGKPGATKGKKASEATRRILSATHTGSKRTKESIEKQRATYKAMLAAGLVDTSVSHEQRKQISQTLIGNRVMHKGDVDKHVLKDEIDAHLKDGWEYGYAKTLERRQMIDNQFKTLKENNKDRHYVRLTNGVENRTVYKQEDIDLLRSQGFVFGLTKKKPVMTVPARKYTILNNKIKNVRAYTQEEIDSFIQQGYVLGTIKSVLRQEEQENKVIKPRKYPYWTKEDIELLSKLVNNFASDQVLQENFPYRKLSAIKNQIYVLRLGPIKTKYVPRFKCVETGKIYTRYTDAAKDLNVHPDGVSMCVRGKQKQTAGYTFVPVEED